MLPASYRALVLGLGLACSCRRPAFTPSAPGGVAPLWQYEVTSTPGGTELDVVASFPAGSDDEIGTVDQADPFATDVEWEGARGWAPVKRVSASWVVPACRNGCRLRYRYRLRDAARAFEDVATARLVGAAVEAPPSTWLLRPTRAVPSTRIRFHVTPAPGEAFVSGVFPADTPGTFEAGVGEYMQLPYSAFGPMQVHELAQGGATLAILPGPIVLPDLLHWAEEALATVQGFYGRLPLRHVLILVRPSDGDEVGFGSTMGYSGGAIAIDVGSEATAPAFRKDWVLVHELVHTALPDLTRDHHWLEEGLATYVEPLARARRGAVTPGEVWGEWAKSMQQGEPAEGDQGLDRTHTWGRTYWGGALFCLVADIEIRKQSRGKASLEDALRAVVNRGGSIAVEWPIERILSVGDAATDTHVLEDLYARMSRTASPVDLPALWRQLGVVALGDGTASMDDTAPLAWIRKAMTPAR